MKRTTQQQITGSDGETECCASSRSTSLECGCSGDPCRDHGSANYVSKAHKRVKASKTHLLANAGKATRLAVLVHCLGDPVDSGIPADLQTRLSALQAIRLRMVDTYRLMVGVHENDLVVFVHTVLVNPVRVQDTQVTASLANALLRDALQATLGLEAVDTLADRLAEGST